MFMQPTRFFQTYSQHMLRILHTKSRCRCIYSLSTIFSSFNKEANFVHSDESFPFRNICLQGSSSIIDAAERSQASGRATSSFRGDVTLSKKLSPTNTRRSTSSKKGFAQVLFNPRLRYEGNKVFSAKFIRRDVSAQNKDKSVGTLQAPCMYSQILGK